LTRVAKQNRPCQQKSSLTTTNKPSSTITAPNAPSPHYRHSYHFYQLIDETAESRSTPPNLWTTTRANAATNSRHAYQIDSNVWVLNLILNRLLLFLCTMHVSFAISRRWASFCVLLTHNLPDSLTRSSLVLYFSNSIAGLG
jgi:hypothetical protein